jgi:glycerophosphoryl diester phosphodiesterase
VLRVLDVLAQEVGILAIFSDWPATVTYYANCMGLAIEPEVKSSWPRYPLR